MNQRRSDRIKCSFPVSVKTADGRTLATRTRDISPEGLLLEIDAKETGVSFKTNQNVELVLSSPFLSISQSAKKRKYRVIGGNVDRAGHRLIRLALVPAGDESEGLQGFDFIKCSNYVIPTELEFEYLKTLELINFKLVGASSKIVVITAAEESAGVSTFSWWFASCLARSAERKVLYVDANLRPGGNRENGDIEDGLFELLAGRSSLDDTVVTIDRFAPGIINRGGSFEILAGEITESMIQTTFQSFRDSYNYIIVDALPVVSSPLSLMMAREADGTLLVVEARKTRKQSAEDSLALMHQVGCNVLGGVLNRF